MANLYLMCGVPGCGKSTFLKNKIKNNNSVIISRDTIKFFGIRLMKRLPQIKLFMLIKLLLLQELEYGCFSILLDMNMLI